MDGAVLPVVDVGGGVAIVGDIAPSDGVKKEDKRRLEASAMDELQESLGNGPVGTCEDSGGRGEMRLQSRGTGGESQCTA